MILAVLADLLIGGVRGKYHPMMLMESVIDHLMDRAYSEDDSPLRQRHKGLIFVCTIMSAFFAVVLAVVIVLHNAGPWYHLIGAVIILMCMISPRRLAASANEIQACIAKGDISQARELAERDADYDTDKLGAQEITRSVIEVTARGIVSRAAAPLFYYFVGGISFMAAYCAVHMMYSVLCTKDEKYYYFGLPIAKLNDLFLFIPSRLAAMLIIISAYILQYDGHKASEIVQRDAKNHCNINDGYPEAAVAGALRIRLGGTSYYDGEPYFHEYIGDAVERLEPHHIEKAVRLLYMTTLLLCMLDISLRTAKQIGGF